MTKLEFKLASRYLRGRRSSRWVSLITLIATGGVMIGVMALVVVMGIMNGMQDDLRDKILIGNPHIRILTYGEGLRLDEWRSAQKTVSRNPEVVAVAPFVLTQGLVSAGHDYAEGAAIIGLDADTGKISVTSLARHFTQGDLDFTPTRPDVQGGVVLGRRLAERLSVFPGDKVTVVSPAGSRFNSAVGAYIPQWWNFEVTGRFNTGMYEYDNNYMILSRRVAQDFAGLGDAVTGLEVRVKDPWKAREIGAELEDSLGYPYRALDWQTQNASFFSALKLEKLGMGLVLLLIILVAAFNIVGTLTMVVRDKTREIGILRAMGLPVGAVRRTFLIQGAVIGLVGTGIGSALGVIVGHLIDTKRLINLDPSVYLIDRLPVHISPADVLIITVASFLVAVVATLYPAWQASRLTPVEAIRHE